MIVYLMTCGSWGINEDGTVNRCSNSTSETSTQVQRLFNSYDYDLFKTNTDIIANIISEYMKIHYPCQVSNWSEWNKCKVEDNKCIKTRTRTITKHGVNCPDLQEKQTCED